MPEKKKRFKRIEVSQETSAQLSYMCEILDIQKRDFERALFEEAVKRVYNEFLESQEKPSCNFSDKLS